MRRRHTEGYTLIEMAIALAVLGTLTGMMLTMLTGQTEAAALKAQKAQMKDLDEALLYHVKLRGRLPCPADPTLAETDVNFAREDCTYGGSITTIDGPSDNEDIVIGMLPTRTLNLSDRMLYDRWGSRIAYSVIQVLTESAAKFAAYTTTEDTGVIHITDSAGNPMTQQLPDRVVAYALLSFGKDKNGGYNRVGSITHACDLTRLDGANCDNADNFFVDTELNDSRFNATYYHDMLRWMDLAQLRNAVDSDVDSRSTFILVLESGNNRIQRFDSDFNYVSQFGAAGNADGEFNSPYEFTTDSDNNIYVSDSGNNRVQVFSSDGTFIKKFGSFGSGNGQFNDPVGIAVDDSGNIFVVDNNNSRVQKFDSGGNFLLAWGTAGSGNGQFNNPQGIAIDASGNVYVVDTTNSRIQVFTNNGAFVNTFGSNGNGNGQFFVPLTLDIDDTGNLWVADTGNQRIQILTSSGVYVNEFGFGGNGDGQFNNPEGPIFDEYGNAYVADTGNQRIQIFSPSGVYVNQFGTAGNGDGQLNTPEGAVVIKE